MTGGRHAADTAVNFFRHSDGHQSLKRVVTT